MAGELQYLDRLRTDVRTALRTADSRTAGVKAPELGPADTARNAAIAAIEARKPARPMVCTDAHACSAWARVLQRNSFTLCRIECCTCTFV
eukprot:SAG11_NODE_2631_length_3155_cov_2.254908_4_plen_91_part_00